MLKFRSEVWGFKNDTNGNPIAFWNLRNDAGEMIRSSHKRRSQTGYGDYSDGPFVFLQDRYKGAKVEATRTDGHRADDWFSYELTVTEKESVNA